MVITNKHTSIQALILRARIIFVAEESVGLRAYVRLLSCDLSMIGRCRKHWVNRPNDLSATECLKDDLRSSVELKFTAEQICKIIVLACEKPEDNGYAISHWFQNALAKVIDITETTSKHSDFYVLYCCQKPYNAWKSLLFKDLLRRTQVYERLAVYWCYVFRRISPCNT